MLSLETLSCPKTVLRHILYVLVLVLTRCLEHQLRQFNLLYTFRIQLSKCVTCLLIYRFTELMMNNNNDELCYSWYITALMCDSMMLTLRLCLGASVLVLVLVFGDWCLCLGLGLEDCCLINNTAIDLSNNSAVKYIYYSHCFKAWYCILPRLVFDFCQPSVLHERCQKLNSKLWVANILQLWIKTKLVG